MSPPILCTTCSRALTKCACPVVRPLPAPPPPTAIDAREAYLVEIAKRTRAHVMERDVGRCLDIVRAAWDAGYLAAGKETR